MNSFDKTVLVLKGVTSVLGWLIFFMTFLVLVNTMNIILVALAAVGLSTLFTIVGETVINSAIKRRYGFV